MPINYFSVKRHLLENGWELLSTEYKNLKTPLKMKCPNGHEIEQTYEFWRENMLCDECLRGDENVKITRNAAAFPKEEGKKRILALDAATKITGYAIYDNQDLVTFGTFSAEGDQLSRINQIKHWLKNMIKEWQPDLVGLEDIQLQTYGRANDMAVGIFHLLSNLQGVLLDTAYENKIPVKLVFSSAWRKACGLSGANRAEDKAAAQKAALRWYHLVCTQDESDAICIGKYFARNEQ